MHIDENQIIKKCQQGDLEKFAQLYDLYVEKIFRFVFYKTQHKETAEDIVSETFIKALKGIGNFRGNLGTFQAWLFKIARNSVVDYYRAKKNSPTKDIEEVWDLGENNSILETLTMKQEAKKVVQYFKNLSPIQREILILRVWEEMPYNQIAEIVNKDKNNCKVIFARTIKKLKEEAPLFIIFLLLLKNL